MAIRPVNRIKHVTDFAATLAAALQLDMILIQANDNPVLANTTEVQTGSKVNGVYLDIQVAASENVVGGIANVYLIVTKSPGGNITLPVPNLVGGNDNKRFVIHQEMLMLQNSLEGNPRSLFKGVISIPKGMRRFAPNDVLFASVISPTVNITVCEQSIYKEFR